MNWSDLIIAELGKAEGLRIAPLRSDGKTYGTPTWIWVVAAGNDLYVRAYSGTGSTWYQAAMSQRAGQVTCNGVVRNVRFDVVSNDENEAVDEAYRAKYRDSQYLQPMIAARSRAATVKVLPFEDHA